MIIFLQWFRIYVSQLFLHLFCDNFEITKIANFLQIKFEFKDENPEMKYYRIALNETQS